MSDIRAAAARDYHLRASKSEEQADRYRAQRDRLVRWLRDDDPGHWSYKRLAVAVGCSPELIAYIVKNPPKD